MDLQEQILQHIDTDYSYRLARQMEQYRCNPVLGYRSAGSRAEYLTGELLREEMERIGLFDVTKDAITADCWEFRKAELTFQTLDGDSRCVQLGAYQTTLVTKGAEGYSLLYLGKGTEADYQGRDVTGKLVLVDINQRDEWWINYPVYQAHLKGARALIAVQSGGYGEIDDEALNAQDIAGPEDAPAFSISRKDAALLKELIKQSDTGEIRVLLEADTRVVRDQTTYNIVGQIPGKHPDRMVLLSAHYDSYFSGFQDDNTAVAMMLSIAKTLLKSGMKPNNTIVFCAMAAEEWGVADSNFDWSTGAYEQVFTAHPEWVGKVIADLNFELPALAHGTRARIRSCYEYTRFLEDFLSELPELTQAYPEETRVTAPIETWSDDFSIAISGIPSMVNDFTGGSFMETHYHSQFDNDDFYDEQVYRMHHELFALLIVALDQTAVVPLCFTPVIKRLQKGLEEIREWEKIDETLDSQIQAMCRELMTAEQAAIRDYEQICADNRSFRSLFETEIPGTAAVPQSTVTSPSAVVSPSAPESQPSALLREQSRAEAFFQSCIPKEQRLLAHFKAEQDHLVRIDWYGNVLYPHEILFQTLKLIDGAAVNLQEGHISSALRKLYQVDNNAYAFTFDEEVYRHFSDYVFHQPKERLKWGYHRLMPHRNLYALVKGLLKKEAENRKDLSEEIFMLQEIYQTQYELLVKTIKELKETLEYGQS